MQESARNPLLEAGIDERKQKTSNSKSMRILSISINCYMVYREIIPVRKPRDPRKHFYSMIWFGRSYHCQRTLYPIPKGLPLVPCKYLRGQQTIPRTCTFACIRPLAIGEGWRQCLYCRRWKGEGWSWKKVSATNRQSVLQMTLLSCLFIGFRRRTRSCCCFFVDL